MFGKLMSIVLLETDTQWTQSGSKMDGQYKYSKQERLTIVVAGMGVLKAITTLELEAKLWKFKCGYKLADKLVNRHRCHSHSLQSTSRA